MDAFSKNRAIFYAMVFCIVVPGLSLAKERKNPEHKGFFWGEEIESEQDQELEPEKPETLPKPSPLPQRSELMKMPPQQIKRMMQERLEYALYIKTPEATKDYLTLKDIARRNASVHTSLSGYVLANNAELNPRSQYSITQPGAIARRQATKTRLNSRLKTSRHEYALIMLTDPSCSYCPVQRNILKRFAKKHQWNVTEVDVTQSPEIAAFFNASITPMTVVIKKDSDQWQPVSVGVESVSRIEKNLSSMLRMLEGELDPKQYYTSEQDKGGFLDPLSFMDEQGGDRR